MTKAGWRSCFLSLVFVAATPLCAGAQEGIATIPEGDIEAEMSASDASDTAFEPGPLEPTLSRLCMPIDPIEYGLAPAQASRIAPERVVRFNELIEAAARQHRVPASLIRSVVSVESAYDPNARSPKGAMGLMQLMPATGSRFGATNLADPQVNINAGTRYLRWLIERFDNDLPLVLAAYNAGEGSVAKHVNRIPPYPETRHYVARVLATFRGECGLPYLDPGPVRTPLRTAVEAPALRPDALAGWVEKGASIMHGLLYRKPGR